MITILILLHLLCGYLGACGFKGLSDKKFPTQKHQKDYHVLIAGLCFGLGALLATIFALSLEKRECWKCWHWYGFSRSEMNEN